MPHQDLIRILQQRNFHVTSGLNYAVDLLIYTQTPDKVHSKYGAVIVRHKKYKKTGFELFRTFHRHALPIGQIIDLVISDVDNSNFSADDFYNMENPGDQTESNAFQEIDPKFAAVSDSMGASGASQRAQGKMSFPNPMENDKFNIYCLSKLSSREFLAPIRLTYRLLLSLQRTLNMVGKTLVIINEDFSMVFEVQRV